MKNKENYYQATLRTQLRLEIINLKSHPYTGLFNFLHLYLAIPGLRSDEANYKIDLGRSVVLSYLQTLLNHNLLSTLL